MATERKIDAQTADVAALEAHLVGDTDCPEPNLNWTYAVDSREVKGVHHPDCRGGCNGTGKVARFPTLRWECLRQGGLVDDVGVTYGVRHPPECSRCGGQNWVPDVTESKLFDILEEHYPGDYIYYEYEPGWYRVYVAFRGKDKINGWGNTRYEALVRLVVIMEVSRAQNR